PLLRHDPERFLLQPRADLSQCEPGSLHATPCVLNGGHVPNPFHQEEFPLTLPQPLGFLGEAAAQLFQPSYPGLQILQLHSRLLGTESLYARLLLLPSPNSISGAEVLLPGSTIVGSQAVGSAW